MPDTYYIFNHVDIVIYYHSKDPNAEWGKNLPDGAARLISAKLTPRRSVGYQLSEFIRVKVIDADIKLSSFGQMSSGLMAAGCR